MTRSIVIAMAIVALVLGVVVLQSQTMSTHVEAQPGSRTEVAVEVDTNNAPSSATRREMAQALVLTCRLHVDAELTSPGLRKVGEETFAFSLVPGLDESDERQLHGCLEDARVDHLQLAVVRLETIPG